MSDGYMVTFDSQKASAVLQVWHDGKTAELELLSSKYRRRGNAGIVLQKALDYADYLNLEVVLEVQPFGDGVGMRDHELTSWYMTFGFEKEGNNVMARPRVRDRLLEEAVADADNEQNSPAGGGAPAHIVQRPDGSYGSSRYIT